MEAITSTEKLISSFNKFSKERNPEDLSNTAKMTIDLFSRRVSQGKVKNDEISDFSDLITMYKYTDTPQVSKDLKDYYSNSIVQSINYGQKVQNVDEISKRIA
jgi:hypothetical protein